MMAVGMVELLAVAMGVWKAAYWAEVLVARSVALMDATRAESSAETKGN